MSDKNISLSYTSFCLLRAINFWRPPVYFWLPTLRKYIPVGSFWLPTTFCDPKRTSYLSHPEKSVQNRRLLWKAQYMQSYNHANQMFLQLSSLKPPNLRHLVPNETAPGDPAPIRYMPFALSPERMRLLPVCSTARLTTFSILSPCPWILTLHGGELQQSFLVLC